MQKLKGATISNWNTGKGMPVSFSKIIDLIRMGSYSSVHIGTDSQIKKNAINYATAICIINPNMGGRYFFQKTLEMKYHNLSLGLRLQKEVYHSIDVAQDIQRHIDIPNIFIHIDVNEKPQFTSSRYAKQLINHVKSMGYAYFIKPDSWASFAVADRHTK